MAFACCDASKVVMEDEQTSQVKVVFNEPPVFRAFPVSPPDQPAPARVLAPSDVPVRIASKNDMPARIISSSFPRRIVSGGDVDQPKRGLSARQVVANDTVAIRQVSSRELKPWSPNDLPAAVNTQDDKKAGGIPDERPWHLMSLGALSEELGTDTVKGLSKEVRAEKLKLHGLNELTAPKQLHWVLKVLLTLVGGFQLMMWGAATLCFIVTGLQYDVQTLALGIVLVLVVLITGVFQAYQEGKSDKVMASLKAMSPATATVFIDGVMTTVNAVEIVPGDLVKVVGGEKVPADLRIIQSNDLKVNNASLTGENVDIKLGPDANHQQLYEAKNVARSGCNFTMGNGTGIVFATGDNTFFGSIALSTTATKRPETQITKEVRRLIHYLAVFAISLGVSFLILALVNGYKWVEAVIFMVGIIVANVPEGLLPQMTVCMTLTAERMRNCGVLVANLEIIETLGATTVICSDKTGTLTCNRMTVVHVYIGGEIKITPNSPVVDGDAFSLFDQTTPIFLEMQRCSALNTEAVFLTLEEDILKRETKGDATEGAIIKFLEPLEPVVAFRARFKRVGGVPFNSTNKWMSSIFANPADMTKLTVFVKGAPEMVLKMCTTVMDTDGSVQAMSDQRRPAWRVPT